LSDDGRALATRRDGATGMTAPGSTGGRGGDNVDAFGGTGGVAITGAFNGQDGEPFGAGGMHVSPTIITITFSIFFSCSYLLFISLYHSFYEFTHW
jgi:hypothetical protein